MRSDNLKPWHIFVGVGKVYVGVVYYDRFLNAEDVKTDLLSKGYSARITVTGGNRPSSK